MNPDEIGRLLQAAPPEWSMIYWLALESGLRAREIHSLKVGDFDPEKTTILLAAENAKDRLEIEFPISTDLCETLKLYTQDRDLDEKLFPHFNLNQQYKYLYKHLDAAGIARETREGKLDFHALRTMHVNLGLALGFDAKTVQSLARHKSIDLTMNVYAKPHAERMRSAVQALGNCIRGSVDEAVEE